MWSCALVLGFGGRGFGLWFRRLRRLGFVMVLVCTGYLVWFYLWTCVMCLVWN